MVQVAAHEIVDMIAVRRSFMAAAGTVRVTAVMGVALVLRCTSDWIRFVYCDRMLIHMIPVDVMQVSFMKVIRVAFVNDSFVAAL